MAKEFLLIKKLIRNFYLLVTCVFNRFIFLVTVGDQMSDVGNRSYLVLFSAVYFYRIGALFVLHNFVFQRFKWSPSFSSFVAVEEESFCKTTIGLSYKMSKITFLLSCATYARISSVPHIQKIGSFV